MRMATVVEETMTPGSRKEVSRTPIPDPADLKFCVG
jgi:hypothetical protein